MYLIDSMRNGEWIYDPGMSMALQDYVKEHLFLDDDILFSYMMKSAIQIGIFQNAYEEFNHQYLMYYSNEPIMMKPSIVIDKLQIAYEEIYQPYNDHLNMSFTVLITGDNNINGNYARLYEPAIKALEKLGVKNVEQKGRNDL